MLKFVSKSSSLLQSVYEATCRHGSSLVRLEQVVHASQHFSQILVPEQVKDIARVFPNESFVQQTRLDGLTVCIFFLAIMILIHQEIVWESTIRQDISDDCL